MGRRSLRRLEYRLSTPKNDDVVNQWMNMQDDRSAAVRWLIHEDVRQHGYRNVLLQAMMAGGQSAVAAYGTSVTPVTPVTPVAPVEMPASQPVVSQKPDTVEQAAAPVQPTQTAQPAQPENTIPRDEDGFVDPEDLFK